MAKSKGVKSKSGAAKSGGAKSGGGKPGGDGVIEGQAEERKKKKSVSPFVFFQQVRAEGSKVTWTSRNETMVSTIMVLIMVAIMAIFFFAVDTALRAAVCTALPIDCVSRDV